MLQKNAVISVAAERLLRRQKAGAEIRKAHAQNLHLDILNKIGAILVDQARRRAQRGRSSSAAIFPLGPSTSHLSFWIAKSAPHSR
jgi:hypothetical protein